MNDPTWRPLAPQALASRAFGDDAVVYNDVTGSTHHLNALGRAVMQQLLSHPTGIALSVLVRAIAAGAATSPDAELAEAIERTLADLAELRLAALAT